MLYHNEAAAVGPHPQFGCVQALGAACTLPASSGTLPCVACAPWRALLAPFCCAHAAPVLLLLVLQDASLIEQLMRGLQEQQQDKQSHLTRLKAQMAQLDEHIKHTHARYVSAWRVCFVEIYGNMRLVLV